MRIRNTDFNESGSRKPKSKGSERIRNTGETKHRMQQWRIGNYLVSTSWHCSQMEPRIILEKMRQYCTGMVRFSKQNKDQWNVRYAYKAGVEAGDILLGEISNLED